MKHIAMIPLIGGMAIGTERALGRPPEAVVSYDGFWGNDRFLMNWYEKRGLNIPYLIEPTGTDFGEIDVVTSLCPCAGLTSANVQSSAGCQQNTWMLKSTDWALRNVKPKLLVGENASRLYTDFGQPVAATMRLIAERHGYWLALYKTDTRYHGIPQKRLRSFFALYSKEQYPEGTPTIECGPEYHTPYEGTWVDYLDSFPAAEDGETIDWSEDSFFRFLRDNKPEWWKTQNFQSSLDTIALDEELSAKFLAEEDPESKPYRFLQRAREKYSRGLNVWDGSPKTYGDLHPSVMYRSMRECVHPERGTTLKPREHMRLMGLPEDMDVPTDYLNAIAQNVPTCTSEWMVKACLDAKMTDHPPLEGDEIMRQSNCNGKTSYGLPYGSKFQKYGYVHSHLFDEETTGSDLLSGTRSSVVQGELAHSV